MSLSFFWLWLSFLLGSAFSESLEEEQGDPYYGVPLGALHYSAEGTSAEVYAADEFSIIFNHLYHTPRESGCTAMMIGPPRPEDRENVVPDHGLLLPLAHPPVAARHRARRRRRMAERAVPKAVATPRKGEFHGYWPVEFDHLLMGPTGEEGQKKEVGGMEGREAKNTEKEGNDGIMNRVNLSNQSVAEQLIHGTSWALDSSSIPMASTFSPSSTISSSSSSQSHPSVPSAAAGQQSQGISTSTPVSSSSTSTASSTFSSSSAPPPSSSLPSVQPLILLVGKRPTGLGQHQMKMMLGSKEEPQLIRLNEAEIRRAPARLNAHLADWGNGKGNELEEKGIPPTLVAATSTTSTTPLFRVIKDPREGRRQRLIELRKKLDPNYEPPTTSTTAAPFSPLEAQFELPRIRDKLATFALTNGAKITQYKWIGLWNHCTKKHIPLVSLRDVDPPREEKIMPLSGWSHNVTSYRLHILNCNTILIPSFHYDARNTTRNTHFFIGVGQFPEAVEQQIKANVVGQKKGEPLRSYAGEDVLLRLPRPYRTFDIDFISIFNTDEQKSFGHVIIPSLLVPPCPDDDE